MGNGQWDKTADAKRRYVAAAAMAIGLSLMVTGCRQGAYIRDDVAAYPEAMRQAETLNVQVFRDGTEVEMTNTTARRIDGGMMWLNKWYGREIEPIGPGESRRFALKTFKDQYGQSFRAGGFFATRVPDILVLAQIETDGEMLGLIVVENRIE